MPTCKTSTDANGSIEISATDLPIVCKLQNPPKGVTIAEAEFFLEGDKTGVSYAIQNGQSFTIPALAKGSTGNLFVRIIGQYPAATAIYVVEDCDKQAAILAITDRFTKFAYSPIEVV